MMKVLGVVLVVSSVAAACTSDSDALSSKQLSAADIGYDNASAGLVSTNVQDAIDDVVAMAQATDERMAASVIVCKFQTASLNMPASQKIHTHVFTASECGGKMPDAGYIGALASFSTCTHELKAVEVKNSGEADGPGFVITRAYTTNSFSCAGPAAITALFYKLP